MKSRRFYSQREIAEVAGDMAKNHMELVRDLAFRSGGNLANDLLDVYQELMAIIIRLMANSDEPLLREGEGNRCIENLLSAVEYSFDVKWDRLAALMEIFSVYSDVVISDESKDSLSDECLQKIA